VSLTSESKNKPGKKPTKIRQQAAGRARLAHDKGHKEEEVEASDVYVKEMKIKVGKRNKKMN
jgi:hypothetical protein